MQHITPLEERIFSQFSKLPAGHALAFVAKPMNGNLYVKIHSTTDPSRFNGQYYDPNQYGLSMEELRDSVRSYFMKRLPLPEKRHRSSGSWD